MANRITILFFCMNDHLNFKFSQTLPTGTLTKKLISDPNHKNCPSAPGLQMGWFYISFIHSMPTHLSVFLHCWCPLADVCGCLFKCNCPLNLPERFAHWDQITWSPMHKNYASKRNLSCKESPEKILRLHSTTGFEPMTSMIPVQCSTDWAMKPRWKQVKSEFNLYPLYEESEIICIIMIYM